MAANLSYSFIVHPRSIQDLYEWGPGAFLRAQSQNDEEFIQKCSSFPPLKLATLFQGFSSFQGEVITISRMPERMMLPETFDDILQALKLAFISGSKVVGLGALTSPICGGGSKLLKHLPDSGVTLTNGNAYTAAIASHNVLDAIQCFNLDTKATVAVIGCTGSVGMAATEILSKSDLPLILYARSLQRAASLLKDLPSPHQFVNDPTHFPNADIILILGNVPESFFAPEYLKKGAVLIDCTQPTVISTTRFPQYQQKDISVFSGGIVEIPNFHCTYDFRLQGKNRAFACLAETYLFALEGITTHSVGRASSLFAESIEKKAIQRGFKAVPLIKNALLTQNHNLAKSA